MRSLKRQVVGLVVVNFVDFGFFQVSRWSVPDKATWYFSVSYDALDLWPEVFRAALVECVELEQVKLNENDDEGWFLSASYQGVHFHICCRNEIAGEAVEVEHVLWCEGVKKSILRLFDKTTPPPPTVVAAIDEVLRNRVRASGVERA